MMKQLNNWDLWKRMQINVDKAIYNDEVAELLSKHYKYLHSKLVKYIEDEDVFNDTFLKMTYNYDPTKDFIDQFCYYFKLLKGAYFRDSKITTWLVTYIEDHPVEFADTIDEPTATKTEDNFIKNLKEGINANIKEARTTKKKTH